MAYTTLKCVREVVPSQQNHLDTTICQMPTEAEKRPRKLSMVKKKPISTELIKSIVARYGFRNVNLKDLRFEATLPEI